MATLLIYSVFYFFLLPPAWHYNLDEARALARKEPKHVQLYFSGSDWCGPCIIFRKERC